MKKDQMTNAQLKEILLKMIEYLEKELKTKASSETKGSNGLTYNKFCMFARKTRRGGKTVDVVTKEEYSWMF